MKRSFRYRMYPTKAQISILLNILSMCRYLFNWNLQERIDAYKKDKKTITYLEQQNKLPALKKERPWFKGVYSLVLQDVLRRLDKAYKNFFHQKKGFPKFKKKGQYTSITYTQFSKKPENGKIKVPKIGEISLKYHREIPQDAKIKTLTLIKEGSKWFCSFSIELPDLKEPKLEVKSAIGIDLGLENFIYCSNNRRYDAFKPYKAYQKNLKKLQRKLQKTKKRSVKYRKVLKALQKAFYRIKCKREGYHNYLIGKLLKGNDIIFHEDLSISNMVKRPRPVQDKAHGQYLPNGALQKSRLNQAILDVAWGRFLQILKNRAENIGKKVLGVDPKYTTQRCHKCRKIVRKDLKERMHYCPECKLIIPRDYNSALEILRLGLESLGFTALEALTIMRSI